MRKVWVESARNCRKRMVAEHERETATPASSRVWVATPWRRRARPARLAGATAERPRGAAAGGELFAGEEEVEVPAEGEQGDAAAENPGQQPEDLAVADHRQASHHPAHHAEGLGRVGQVLQEEDGGGAGEGDGDARQEEGLGGDALAAQGQADDEGGGGEGAGEAGEGHRREAERRRGA